MLETGQCVGDGHGNDRAALLQTDRADISTKIEAEDVSQMPLSTNRNFQSLLNLVPGTAPAVFQHSQFFNAQGRCRLRPTAFLVREIFIRSKVSTMMSAPACCRSSFLPQRPLQSVDISTNNFEAELGRAIGAVTNVTLKSGSNAFHGSAFEFIQNNAVNARSYFGGPLGHLSYNYFGGSFGGPIKKDKLFFFGDYLCTR